MHQVENLVSPPQPKAFSPDLFVSVHLGSLSQIFPAPHRLKTTVMLPVGNHFWNSLGILAAKVNILEPQFS